MSGVHGGTTVIFINIFRGHCHGWMACWSDGQNVAGDWMSDSRLDERWNYDTLTTSLRLINAYWPHAKSIEHSSANECLSAARDSYLLRQSISARCWRACTAQYILASHGHPRSASPTHATYYQQHTSLGEGRVPWRRLVDYQVHEVTKSGGLNPAEAQENTHTLIHAAMPYQLSG